MRVTMVKDRLSALTVLSIERELAEKIDIDEVIDEFASSENNRRIVF